MSYTEADLQQFLSNPAVRIAGSLGPGEGIKGVVKESLTTGHIANAGKGVPRRGQPNKTEAEYGRMLGMEFPGCRVIFEALSFRMGNGHRYTPDWVVLTPDGVLCVECKARGANGYCQPSYQRAKLAYDQCRTEYPCFRWRWAEKIKGIWEVK